MLFMCKTLRMGAERLLVERACAAIPDQRHVVGNVDERRRIAPFGLRRTGGAERFGRHESVLRQMVCEAARHGLVNHTMPARRWLRAVRTYASPLSKDAVV